MHFKIMLKVNSLEAQFLGGIWDRVGAHVNYESRAWLQPTNFLQINLVGIRLT